MIQNFKKKLNKLHAPMISHDTCTLLSSNCYILTCLWCLCTKERVPTLFFHHRSSNICMMKKQDLNLFMQSDRNRDRKGEEKETDGERECWLIVANHQLHVMTSFAASSKIFLIKQCPQCLSYLWIKIIIIPDIS